MAIVDTRPTEPDGGRRWWWRWSLPENYANVITHLVPFRRALLAFLGLALFMGTLEGIGLSLLYPVLDSLVNPGAPSGAVKFLESLGWFSGRTGIALTLSVVMFALVSAKSVLQIIYSYKSSMITLTIRNRWRESIVSNFLTAKASVFQGYHSGQISDLLIMQTGKASNVAKWILGFLSNFIFALIMFGFLLAVSPLVTVIVLCVFGLSYYSLNAWLKPHARHFGARAVKLGRHVGAIGIEAFLGRREIQIHARTATVLDKFDRACQEQAVMRAKANAITTIPQMVGPVLVSGGLIGGLVWASLQWIDVAAFVPFIVLFVVVGQRLATYFAAAVNNFVNLRLSMPAFRLVTGLLAESPRSEASGSKLPCPGLVKRVELRDVTFRYRPDVPILKGVSMDIERGRVVVVKGESGAGKTTIADLVTGLLTATSGVILLDGVPLDSYAMSSWHARIAYVAQAPFLFDGTIGENIGLGRIDASFEQIRRAAEEAGAAEFIDSLQDGYETPIGEQGITLSGGQRQRIAIARALIRDCDLLILDEPTNNLDTPGCRQIMQALARKSQTGTAILVITHDPRLHGDSTVVYELRDGALAPPAVSPELTRAG